MGGGRPPAADVAGTPLLFELFPVGAFAVGAVWLIELLMKSWFETNFGPLFLFMSALDPARPELARDQLTLVGISILLLLAAAALLRRQERFL